MSLKGLINNQTIRIDDHKRGNAEIKSWDDSHIDVHIDKTTNFKIEGRRQNVRIRIPINSNRPFKIENYRGQILENIPKKLLREISNALENKETRERFMADLIHILKDFGSILSSEEKVRQISNQLSKHFNLEWTEDKIIRYSKDTIKVYTELYRDEIGHLFFITANTTSLKIGQKNGYNRYLNNIYKTDDYSS